MHIQIPEYTPHGKKIETVGIWMSGGVDSSLLCYLTCKSIKESGRQVRVQPYTVRRPKPGNPIHAVPVSRRIKKILKFDLMNEHVVFYPPIDTQEGRDHADGQFFRDQNRYNFKNDIQLLLSGLTKNPPQEVQKGFADGISQEEPIRGEAIDRPMSHCSIDAYGIEHYQIDPIKDLNKQDLCRIYTEEGILDSLYPLTRSCEIQHWDADGNPDHPIDGHCGICWWCEERLWGFDRFE